MVGTYISFGLFLTGVAIGLISSMPLGPINLTLITTVLQMDLHRTLAMAGAVAIVDGVYALAAVSALSILHTSFALRSYIELAGALLVAGYGFYLALLSQKFSLAADRPALPRRRQNASVGALTGVALYVSNPSFIVFWLSIAGTLQARIPAMSPLAYRLLFGLGVVCGTASWFAILLYMVKNTSAHLSPRMVRRLSVIASCLLIGSGSYILLSRLSGQW